MAAPQIGMIKLRAETARRAIADRSLPPWLEAYDRDVTALLAEVEHLSNALNAIVEDGDAVARKLAQKALYHR